MVGAARPQRAGRLHVWPRAPGGDKGCPEKQEHSDYRVTGDRPMVRPVTDHTDLYSVTKSPLRSISGPVS